MAKILIYARIRPTDHSYEGIQTLKHHVHITMGNEDPQAKFSKTQGPRHQFKFCRVFEQNASQEEVFDAIAKNMIDSFLEGYNGTIFAYGQTSSGKTHTIEGSGRRFADRGLIPRTLSYIYKALEKRGEEEESSVHVSYMEIYQDVGYDLLNAGMRPGALMVTLPKVNVSENPSTGEVTVRHLSSHLAATEEVAQSLLFQGSTCRRVAETAMNQCSSRSHSIFTITLTTKTQGAEVVTKSKLNLVDLAGSERVSKTGVEGRILQEAKHINLSLHHLEHVIVSLQQQARHATITPSNSRIGTREKRGGPPPTRSQSSSLATRQNSFGPQAEGVRRSLSSRSGHGRKERENSGPGVRFGSPRPETKGGRGGEGHIPYRNCMLTMVLRDSLGGNCLTAMIATLSAEEQNLWETISTCRFSQRVACITNTARRNEELDDKAVIRRLKQKITELEKEVIALRTGTITEQQAHKAIEGTNTHSHSLTAPEKQQCHHVLYDFFHGKIDNPVTAGINTGAKFQECLVVLRDIVMHALGIAENEKDTSPKQTRDNPVEELTAEVRTGRTSSSRKEKGDARHGNPLQEVDSSARVIWKKAWQVESSESKPSTAEAGSQSHSVEKSSCEQEKRDKGLSHTINLTPSPNSRLSSGFGSLQEEDAALFESSYNQDIAKRNAAQHPSPPPSVHHNVRAATEVQYTHTTSAQGAGAAPSSLHTSSCQYPMATREQRLSSSQKNAAIDTKSSNQTASGSTVRSPNDGTEKRRSSHSSHTHTERKIKVQSTRHQRNPLFPKSPPFEENQANKSPTSPPFGQCHTSKTLSSTDERALQQLKERQVQLLRSREEQQKLTSDVQLLSLKVQEEELGSRLSEVSEQLARQHAQTLRAQQSEASPEQICAERIAEQQLRIKQAKLHQKLLDVQYQTKMLHLHQGEATTPVKSPTRQENLAATTSLQISTPHVLNELARHEIKQSKVQEQIEKLKVSQIEKQLELKEAATRRKIQALKQQLQGSRNIIQSPPVPTPLGLQPNTTYHSSHVDRLVLEPSHTSANSNNGHTQLHSQQGVMRPSQSQQLSSTVWREKATVKPPATAPGTVQQGQRNKHILVEVPRSEIGHMTGSVNENQHIHDQHVNKTAKAACVQLSFIPEPQVSLPSQAKFTGPQQSVVGSLLKMQRKDAFLPPSGNADCKSTSNSRQLLQVSTTASRRHEHTTPNFEVPPKSSEQHATTEHKFAEQPRHHTKTNSVEQTNMKCINQSKFGTPLKRPQTTEERTPEPFQGNNGLKPRLTLPEEVKETEYMTAVQRQKVRVSRIRRCIIAATVIQRAWREYKQRKR